MRSGEMAGRWRGAVGWVLAGFFGTAVPSFGNGFYIPVQDPFATARGNAFAATADRPSAIYYNPAGLTQIDEMQLHVGFYAIELGLDAKIGGTRYSADKEFQYVPQLYFAVPINDSLVAGIGLNTPFGLSTDWGQDTPFAGLATKTEFSDVTLWGVLAYELTESLSIGGGLGVSYGDGELRRMVAPGTEFKFTGDDYEATWIASLHWRPHPQHALGLTYRAHTKFDLEGDAHAGVSLGSASLDLVVPDTLVVGYAYKPNECWTLETNVEWVNWERLDTSTLKTALGSEPIPFNWDANFMYGVGASYHPEGPWTYSAGYIYIENSQPDDTFNPAVADADRHWLSAGVSYAGDNWSMDFAYQYAFSDRSVKADLPLGAAVNGDYDSDFHGLMLSLNKRF